MAIEGDIADDNIAVCCICGEIIFGDDEDSAVCPYCCGYYDMEGEPSSLDAKQWVQPNTQKATDLY